MASTDEVGIGAALAATLAQGPDGGRQEPGDAVAAAASKMAPRLRAAFAGAVAARDDGPDRAAALRTMAERFRPAPRPDAPLGERARALLSMRVERATGRKWLADAPSPRRGYRPPEALVEALARASHAYAYPAGADDRGRGRALLAEAIRRRGPGLPEARAGEFDAPLLGGVDPDEAAAVLALAAHHDEGARLPPPVLLAAATGAGECSVVALGALARGAAGGADEDPLGRAGRELSELGLTAEATWHG